MKTHKIIIILTGAFIMLLQTVNAQEKMSRMEKDIDVFEKVVTQLFKENDQFISYRGNNDIARGTYVPGYGVIIQLPGSRGQFFYPAPVIRNDDMEMNINEVIEGALDQSRQAIKEANLQIREANKQMKEQNKYLKDEDKKLMEHDKKLKSEEKKMKNGNKEIREYEEFTIVTNDVTSPIPPIPPVPPMAASMAPGNIKVRVYKNDEADSALQKKQIFIMDKMKQALQNYADLITQLGPNEKILIIYDEQSVAGNANKFTYRIKDKEVSFPKISAEVKKEDIDAYRSGKIDSKTFGTKIKTETLEQNNEGFMDYKIFAGILETVFDNSSETPFHVKNNINFTCLSGFGVIYHARMSSPYYNYDWNTNLFDEEKKHDKEPDKDKENKQYEALAATLKNNMLDYGRTIRALKDDQFILLNIQLPEKESSSPKMSVKVKKEILSKYEKGALTREKALEAITVSRN